ncbi:MAG: OmpA family protein [Woeseiaceae bacterium]|nr:OmpA family protein [Woeseiaceae bacterium]
MFRNTILAGCITALAAAPAFAESPSKEENIGVGVGAVVGAIAGGPVGFIIGAAAGAKLGDEFHVRNTEIDELTASLEGSQDEISKLERNIAALGGDIERLQSESRPELLALLQAGIEMDLLFRTDEHTLADTTGSRLTELARSLATMPDVFVRLDGFADERGDAEYNRKLSVRRAEHVMHVLLANGVPASRITVNAHGESPAADDKLDSLAFERKVSLTLYVDAAPSFAANPQ